MTPSRLITAALAGILTLTAPSLGDELRNVKAGQPVPQLTMDTIDGSRVEPSTLKGSVFVLVYVLPEQRSSELAATESQEVVSALNDSAVKLVHITAEAASREYFLKFRREHHIAAPLAIDADHDLYHKLGMIVFPTTIVADRDGNLQHVISLRGLDYSKTLDAYIRHAQGSITLEQMNERLKTIAPTDSSPRSLASAHRAAARLHRDKGRLEDAREELVAARRLDPTDVETELDLAELDISTGKVDDAETNLESILKAQPEHRRARQLKGICLFKRGKLSEAEKVLLDALRLNPDPSRAHYYLGRIYEQQGDSAKALEHYREALRKSLHEPDDAPPASH